MGSRCTKDVTTTTSVIHTAHQQHQNDMAQGITHHQKDEEEAGQEEQSVFLRRQSLSNDDSANFSSDSSHSTTALPAGAAAAVHCDRNDDEECSASLLVAVGSPRLPPEVNNPLSLPLSIASFPPPVTTKKRTSSVTFFDIVVQVKGNDTCCSSSSSGSSGHGENSDSNLCGTSSLITLQHPDVQLVSRGEADAVYVPLEGSLSSNSSRWRRMKRGISALHHRIKDAEWKQTRTKPNEEEDHDDVDPLEHSRLIIVPNNNSLSRIPSSLSTIAAGENE